MIGARRTVAGAAGRRLICLAAWGILAGAAAAAATPASATASTLRVNSTRDVLGRCSLRQAIEAVDVPWKRTACGAVGRRSNTIVLGAGRFTLSITPRGPDDNTSGDLNVTGAAPLTIIGAGANATVLDAGSLGDRVLAVAHGARLTLAGLTIAGGRAPGGAACPTGMNAVPADGGGVFNGGTLTLDAVAVSGNRAGPGGGCAPGAGGDGGSGGGIYNEGTLVVSSSAIYENRAGAGGPGSAGGAGGGIFSAAGRLTITNSTLAANFAGDGVAGGNGGAVALVGGRGSVRNATVADNGAGGVTGLSAGGSGGAGAMGAPGSSGAGAGLGGGLFVQAAELRLQNTIVASNLGGGCAGRGPFAIANGGHDLSFGDNSCPGAGGNARLGPLKDNGGPTETMAIGPKSAAIDRVPMRAGDCPSSDQRGVRRPQRRRCDIGAYEFALPSVTISAPFQGAFYERGSRILAGFRCSEGGITTAVASCTGSVRPGRSIVTSRAGSVQFVVTAVDKAGSRTTATVRYHVFEYVDPLREVSGLTRRRIDLGVDYAGSGPLLAMGRARVTFASNTDSGPPSCWAISCWPGGGIVVYRLLDGPFAGRYVYVAEHISVAVRTGQTVSPGQQVATLYPGYPWSEWGWAAGAGPEALAMADGHRCPCSDPGDWSTIDGRLMNALLVSLGAPSGFLQANTPAQRMPPGWPTWPG